MLASAESSPMIRAPIPAYAIPNAVNMVLINFIDYNLLNKIYFFLISCQDFGDTMIERL